MKLYPLDHPYDPNFLRPSTIAWKKHVPNKIALNSFLLLSGDFEMNSSLKCEYALLKLAFKSYGASLATFKP